MNSHYFGAEDWSAKAENLKDLEYIAYYDIETKELTAFVLFQEYPDYVRGLRSGVLRRMRGQGLGKRLYKRMGRLAKMRGKSYKTYTSSDALPSLNAHIKAGMFIEKIEEHNDKIFVHLTTPRPKGAPDEKER